MPDRLPSKEKIRKWLSERVKSHKPLPSQKELRRSLGMDLIDEQRRKKSK